MVGRLDPKTGDIKLVTMASPRAQPYGMVFNSKGTIFFDEFGINKIANMDPCDDDDRRNTCCRMPGSRPRRIAITSDDIIWYGDYSKGRLGRLDPKTGKVTEYNFAERAALAALRDHRHQRHHLVQRIRQSSRTRWCGSIPKTEKFQTWAIPSGGGVVRNMMPTRDGNIAMAESG